MLVCLCQYVFNLGISYQFQIDIIENGIFFKWYILVKIFFGREVGGCLGLSVQGLAVKLDALKAFDRVSQHRQIWPKVFSSLCSYISFNIYPWALTSSRHHINSMWMHVNVQGYHKLCQSGIGPLVYPSSLSIQELAPPQGTPSALLIGVKNSPLLQV